MASYHKQTSWIIRNRLTGEVIMETFDRKKVDTLNTKKYEAVPILDYLVSLNKGRKKNPLYKGYSPDIIGRNIAEALKKGVPHNVAIAIALKTARQEYRAKHPTGPFPRHLKMVGKVRGKNPISEKTAHKLRKAAPGTFQHMTDEEIKRGVEVKRKKKRTVKKKAKRKNPVSTLIKVFKHGPGEKKFQKVGYFTGTGWDTSAAKAEKYSAGKARELAAQLKIPPGWGLALVTG